MNVLLVRPRPHRNTVNLQSFMICEPLELETVAARLERDGHSVDIADLLVGKLSLEKFLTRKRYELVGLTAYLPHVGIVKKLAARVKKFDPSIFTVAGGVHAEVVPEDFYTTDIDFVAWANGVETVARIANAISGGASKSDIVRDVRGIFATGREKEKPLVPDCTVLPLRNKTAAHRAKYNYIFHNECAIIKTSFGCPFNCAFCFCTRITDGRFIERGLDDVINELKTIDEKNVFIVDDNFLSRPERVLEFCRRLRKEGLSKNFILFGRADFVANHPEVILELKLCGLKGVFVGIESFRDGELTDLNKRTTVEQNICAMNFLDENEIDVYSGIVTTADFTRADFDNMIEYLRRFRAPMPNIQPLTPIPGTPLYEREKDNLVLPRERYELWDMAHLAFRPTKMSVRAYYCNIFRAYLKTTASRKTRQYIKQKYGKHVYRRTLKGARAIAWQYIKLIVRGK